MGSVGSCDFGAWPTPTSTSWISTIFFCLLWVPQHYRSVVLINYRDSLNWILDPALSFPLKNHGMSTELHLYSSLYRASHSPIHTHTNGSKLLCNYFNCIDIAARGQNHQTQVQWMKQVEQGGSVVTLQKITNSLYIIYICAHFRESYHIYVYSLRRFCQIWRKKKRFSAVFISQWMCCSAPDMMLNIFNEKSISWMHLQKTQQWWNTWC